jgi:hypothetical protein
VSVTVVPLFTFEMQDGVEQLTPVPVTVPVPTTCTVTGYVLSVNVAVTVLAAAIELTVHTLPEVVLQPTQPVKVYSADAVAVSEIDEPESSEAAHGKVVQLTPVPVTVPEPFAWIVSAYFTSVNVATTVVPPLGTVSMQVPEPVHGPENASVDAADDGAPVTVTAVPCGMFAEQVVPQLMLPPCQVAVTVPLPFPCREITKLAFLSAKVALTVTGAEMVGSKQVAALVIVQPDQVLKSESDPGVAISDSAVPESTETVQAPAVAVAGVQLTLLSAVATVPFPLSWMVTAIFLGLKDTETAAAASIVETTQVAPVVVLQPVQAPKSESAPGTAVSVMLSP